MLCIYLYGKFDGHVMLWAIDVPQMSLQREAKMRIRANL